MVIAPYATALAAMIDPAAAVQNFMRLAEAGGSGATAFTKRSITPQTRVPEGENVAVVRAYMAHHQGMSLVALANVLDDGVMRTAFMPSRSCKPPNCSCRNARRATCWSHGRGPRKSGRSQVRDLIPPLVRRFNSPHDAAPAHASAFQRPLRRDAHGRGFRLQPLARHCHHSLAGRPHARLLGHLHFSSRSAQRRKSGPPGISRAASNRIPTKWRFSEDRVEFGGAMARSPPRSKSSCRRRTTRRCAASRSPTWGAEPATSKSPPTPSSSWLRRPRTWRIRRFPICSCRPNLCRSSAPCSRRAGSGHPTSSRLGGARGRRGRRNRRRPAI